jgi:hypothetical protein
MPRPRKTPPDGGNVTQATVLQFHDELTEALRLKAASDSKVANVYKRAESAGLDRKTLKAAHKDALKASNERLVDHERYCQYMRWLGVPVDETPDEPDETGDESAANGEDTEAVARHRGNKAYEEGVYAGKAGANMAASNAYQPGTEEHQSFSLGWSAGQKEAVEALGGATRRTQPASADTPA